MSRHASAEELASLDLGGLKPRKAAKIRAHVAGCAQCTQLNSQMSALPATLASVSYPPMPANMSARVDNALAAESAHRLASAPASEAHRRDLPERSRRTRKPAGGWQLPGMSVLGTRLAAAAGALVIVGVGGYELASHAGGNVAGTSAASSGSAARPSVGQMSAGPDVRYGEPTSTKSIRTVTSTTNFTAATLGTQAMAALQGAKLRGYLGAQATTSPAPTAHANSSNGGVTSSSAPGESQLASCLDGVAGNQPVALVEQANYQGHPATIIMTAQTATRPAEVWAVGPSCSASHPDVLDHVSVSRT
jgi:anti-sigma factor ChrR (cupin superfamily)